MSDLASIFVSLTLILSMAFLSIPPTAPVLQCSIAVFYSCIYHITKLSKTFRIFHFITPINIINNMRIVTIRVQRRGIRARTTISTPSYAQSVLENIMTVLLQRIIHNSVKDHQNKDNQHSTISIPRCHVKMKYKMLN